MVESSSPRARLALYDPMVREIGDPVEPHLRHQLIYAMCSKGKALEALGQSNEALAVYEEASICFTDAGDLDILHHVADVLSGKGIHVISMRKATKREREIYFESIAN